MLSENTMPLLDFLYELPKGYHDYPAHVLRLIDQYLGYHMLTYSAEQQLFGSAQCGPKDLD